MTLFEPLHEVVLAHLPVVLGAEVVGDFVHGRVVQRQALGQYVHRLGVCMAGLNRQCDAILLFC